MLLVIKLVHSIFDAPLLAVKGVEVRSLEIYFVDLLTEHDMVPCTNTCVFSK